MLQSTETIVATPETAPLEPTPITDQSATVDPPQTEETTEAEPKPETKTEETPELTPDQIAQAKKDQDFQELRTHKTTLETELTGMRQKLGEYGGESHLQIMQPLLKVAAEIPRTEQEMETWSGNAWKAAQASLLPAQIDGLQTEAAWAYMNHAKGQRAMYKALYGEGVTPDIIREFVDSYNADPSVMDLLRPDEDADQKAFRLVQAEKDRISQERIQQLEDGNKRQDELFQKQQAQTVMTKAAEVGFAPRAEVKKQFGLEFHKNGDTPEIASFKQKVDARYDKIATLMLMNDPQLNHLWTAAEYLAGQKDDAQRQRANSQYAPQIQERVRAVCTQVAQDLAEDLKLFSPGLSDQARVKDLKDLPANVAGGGTTVAVTSGIDLSDMPDPVRDPRGHSAWVSKKIAEDAKRRSTPGILQVG